ncbi:hypothetical protein ALC62_03916 [Cyphomyrmex costatus]|uniref:Uncharacterized protein n=1 Tax=Cyphomyrmex costatus TaxID=456900 RepID=A0A195CWR6_9HYME|nr:hypothetical protein ALC62_03916 [Cyphomyrmex costatus]
MVPAGLRDHSTTTTAVTRRIALPAAVTGVTADTWNVTGYVASGVASRRKVSRVVFNNVAFPSTAQYAQRSPCKKSRGDGNDTSKNPQKTKFVFRVIRVQTRRAAIKLGIAVASRVVQAGNRKLERAATTAVADVAASCGHAGFKGHRKTREKSNK